MKRTIGCWKIDPLWLGDLCSLHGSAVSLARQIPSYLPDSYSRIAPGKVAVKMKPI